MTESEWSARRVSGIVLLSVGLMFIVGGIFVNSSAALIVVLSVVGGALCVGGLLIMPRTRHVEVDP